MTAKTIIQPIRKCGTRKINGVYLVSEGSGGGSLPLWTRLNPPIPCAYKVHRGPIVVDGRKLLARLPEDAWLAGNSAARFEQAQGHIWALTTFGMSADKRIETGDCKGAKSPKEALMMLRNKIRWDDRIVACIRNLSKEKVANLPRVTEHFASMVRCIQEYVATKNGALLVEAVAYIWRLFDATAPTKKAEVSSTLSSMLALLGLMEDGMQMIRETRKSQPLT